MALKIVIDSSAVKDGKRMERSWEHNRMGTGNNNINKMMIQHVNNIYIYITIIGVESEARSEDLHTKHTKRIRALFLYLF